MLPACLLACVCVCVFVGKEHCGKTTDWIRMPFGMVSGVGRGMGVLVGGGDRRRERGSFGRPIVTNGAFATRLFSNYLSSCYYSAQKLMLTVSRRVSPSTYLISIFGHAPPNSHLIYSRV